MIDTYSKQGVDSIAKVPGEVERLKWVGIYPQRQGGDAFMMRIKVPGGVMTAAQVREVGIAADAFAEGPDDSPVFGNRYADLTTRQDIQLHWIRIADVPRIWQRFWEVGLTTVQACGDSARNVCSCPVSGIDAKEVVDAYPVAQAISAFFTGNREYANLPRKWKVAVTGCTEDCARVEINDVGLWPAERSDGTVGFNVLIGGGLSDGERMASDIDVFIRADQAVELCRGVAQLFGELGNRENRGLARMRYLAQELGPEGFRAALDERTNFALEPAGRELTTAFRGDHVGVHPQKQPGLFYVGCSVPVGRMHGIDLVELARLAETYGDGGVRIGTDQNFIVSGCARGSSLTTLLAEPLMQTYSPFPGPFERGVVACTGSEFCRFAVVETKERAVKWASALDAQLTDGDGDAPADTGVIRMHFSGCSASCAQPQIADIGFRGDIAHVEEHIEEAVDIGLGGSLGPDAAFIDWLVGAMPVDDVPGSPSAHRLAVPRRASSQRALLSLVAPEHFRRPPLHARARGRGRDAMKRYRLREQMNGITEPPGKVWFWELEAGVIHADRCIQCGTCVAVCPSNSIGIDEDTDLPELVKMCTGCSLCWDFCPRGGLRYEALWPPSTPVAGEDAEVQPAQVRSDSSDTYWKISGGPPADGLGAVAESYAVRASAQLDDVQDGGAVSALLIGLLAAGEIDGALVSKPSADPDEQWKGVATVATTADEIRAASGSFYNQTMALAELDLSSYPLPPRPRIAVVGTPCEIQGLRAMQARRWPTGAHRVDAVVLTIALMCTKNFDYEALTLKELRDKRGVDLDRVSKMDVIRGRMIVEYRDGELAVDEPVKDFHGAALKGCDECADFLGRSADISVGSVGSMTGWTSVLVRTERGRLAFQAARAKLDVRGLDDPAALLRLDALDKKIAGRSLQRKLDPDAPLFIDFEEHVRAYDGTDRQPVFIRH